MLFNREFVSLIAGLSALVAFVPAGAQMVADSGAFVLRLGRDTLKVERFVFRDGALRSESVARGAGVELQRVDAMLNADGTVARMQTRVYNWPVTSTALPIGGGVAYVAGDSTILEVGLPPTVHRVAYAGRGRVFNLGVGPFIFALYVPIGVHSPGRVGDRLIGHHFADTLGQREMIIRRVAPDWVTAESSFMGRMRIRVDSAGRVRELDGLGSSLNFHGERVGWVDLDSVARSFEEKNRIAGAISDLSPRDSVLARIGNARVRVDYNRPSKRDRTVFGGIVPWNRVWRTGANRATLFATDRALAFGDVVVPAGRYTLFTVPTEAGWTLILNRQTGQWGTEHDASQDLARVPMRTSVLAAPIEKFTILVEPERTGGIVRLRWDVTEATARFSVR